MKTITEKLHDMFDEFYILKGKSPNLVPTRFVLDKRSFEDTLRDATRTGYALTREGPTFHGVPVKFVYIDAQDIAEYPVDAALDATSVVTVPTLIALEYADRATFRRYIVHPDTDTEFKP